MEIYNLNKGMGLKTSVADLISKFGLEVYSEPADAAFKALGIR